MKHADIHISPDQQVLYTAVYNHFFKSTRQAINERGRALVVLSGGSTPQGLFELLRQASFVNEIAWQHIHIFWADERCVPADHPQSNYGQAMRLLLNHVAIPPENIHPIDGCLEPADAAQKYEDELHHFTQPGQPFPLFDWVLLGMGADGHTASLFPGSFEPKEQTRLAIAVTADYEGRPAERVSLTSNAINHAARIVFLVTGSAKAATVQRVLQGPYTPDLLPAQRIQPKNSQLTWFIDQEAASLLENQ